MPPQYLPAAQAPTDFSNLHGRGQSGKADRSFPARTEGTGISFRRLRPVLLSSPPVPPVCAPPFGSCSASRVPRSFCRPLALLWAVAALPRLRAFFPAFKEFPRSLPAKAAPATRRKSNSGNPRTPSPCRMAHGSPHAPCPHGLRSLSVKEKGPFPVVMLSLYQIFHILVENTPVMLSSSSFPFLPSIKIHKKVEFIFFEITI